MDFLKGKKTEGLFHPFQTERIDQVEQVGMHAMWLAVGTEKESAYQSKLRDYTGGVMLADRQVSRGKLAE